MVFEENKHLRDKDGKFTSKGNESSKSSNSRQEELKNKCNSELPGRKKTIIKTTFGQQMVLQ